MKPVAGPARSRKRHIALLLSLLLMVGVPSVGAGFYLYTIAKDQYASTIGFSVRKEELNSPVEVLGNITSLSGSSSSDPDILYEYLQSQELVSVIDKRIDLRAIYTKATDDPVFAFDDDGSIEDLVDYWRRMVKIYYDSGTGLIEVRVLAFDPNDAQNVATMIFEECSRMINALSAIARDDATRYASEELDKAVERLKQAREAITAFRSRTQIVDPNADIQGQMGLLNTLQAELANELIELDLLRETARENDPRITQSERRIEVIRARIDDERQKFGTGGDGAGGQDYATLVAEYERLTVDREFAEQAYTAALSSYDAAVSEAQRQSRYLAAYVKPTLAETSRFPQRSVLWSLTTLFLFMGWAVMVLVYYSLRDRR